MSQHQEPAHPHLEHQGALGRHQEGQAQLQYLLKVLSPLSHHLEQQGLMLDNQAPGSPHLEYQPQLDPRPEGQQ